MSDEDLAQLVEAVRTGRLEFLDVYRNAGPLGCTGYRKTGDQGCSLPSEGRRCVVAESVAKALIETAWRHPLVCSGTLLTPSTVSVYALASVRGHVLVPVRAGEPRSHLTCSGNAFLQPLDGDHWHDVHAGRRIQFCACGPAPLVREIAAYMIAMAELERERGRRSWWQHDARVECAWCARALLMPRATFRRAARACRRDVARLAERFGVTTAAAQARLDDLDALGCWT